MFNYQLDKLPNEYMGYLIRTDFRIGIQIIQCMKDSDYDDTEKTAICLNLLYGNGFPRDFDIAIDGLYWYLKCGEDKTTGESTDTDQDEVYDFDYDSKLIYSAFMKAYGINLNQVNMHWFEFCALMADLNDTAFSKVIYYRSVDVSDMKGKQLATYTRIKEKLKLPVKYTSEEREAIEKFMEASGIGRRID